MAVKVFDVGGFRFTCDFDSGNLGRVELVEKDAAAVEDGPSEPSNPRPSTSTLHLRAAGTGFPDAEFRLWTRPDCQDTEFENGNRTWFFFGVEGGTPGAVVRFTMMNLNKQSKLFSQGMAPVHLSPGHTHWDRIRDPPTYETVDSNFQMSFKFRFPEEVAGMTYFAFTYPYMYKELQASLERLYRRHGNGGRSYEELVSLPDKTIYFHRENIIRSLENRRLDLLTITGMNGIRDEKEASLLNLFQEEEDNRPLKFAGKKTVFVSARVHPGETCSSHVMNGFIKFLLKENDPRAATLRKKYVFKLVPMLNPDGVVNGHYRTDTRGVNLNRVYGNPSFSLNPTIYAARKLILYAHLGKDVEDNALLSASVPPHSLNPGQDPTKEPELNSSDTESVREVESSFTWEVPMNRNKSQRTSSSSRGSSSLPAFPTLSPFKSADYGSQWYEMTENSRCSEGDESIADFSLPLPARNVHADETPGFDFICPGNVSGKIGERTNFLGAFLPSGSSRTSRPDQVGGEQGSRKGSVASTDEEVNDLTKELGGPTFPTEKGDSGLFMYIDIHGHASKRGIFMYGNHFENKETKVDALLFPKLMAINSANFDFPACNFTQRNMFMKDRHSGAGREGSGRVSVYRATGITYCYTLECNFNTGRFTNNIPMASRDLGRASPPPVFDIPPKYNPAIYEDTGKSLAISVLDLTESNPWSRLTCSSSKNLRGVRSWIRSYLKNVEVEAAAAKLKAVKASPIRTRLRNLAGVKKSAIKQLKLTVKSPKSPEAPRSLSKIPRKILTTKNSQSAPGKLSRQASVDGKPVEPGPGFKRPRTGSLKMKIKRPGSKIGNRSSAKSTSKSNSRSSSPRRSMLSEAKVSKPGLKKSPKGLSKRSASKLQETTSPNQTPATPSVKKIKKKKIIPN